MNSIYCLIVFFVSKDDYHKKSCSEAIDSITDLGFPKRRLRHSVYRFIKTTDKLK
jgi:hypothetical protein